MDASEIQKNKDLFIALCHEHIQRDGVDSLLTYLDKTDFYTAPSSTKFHLNEAGGLCLHSINVFQTACQLYENIAKPNIENGKSPFTEGIPMESIAIATLFHDICKVKLYHPTTKWRKDDNNRWQSYPGYEVKDDFPLGHGEKSCLMLGWYIRLKPEEMLAVRWHMGMFDVGENGTPSRMSFYAATDKSGLVSLVHAADFLSSNLLEKTTVY